MDELAIARIDPAIFLDATSSNELDQQARRLTKIEATERRSFSRSQHQVFARAAADTGIARGQGFARPVRKAA
jgi:hypothetical protein